MRQDCVQESGQCVCKEGWVGRRCNVKVIMHRVAKKRDREKKNVVLDFNLDFDWGD